MYVGTAIVALQLDHDQTASCIDGEQVESFASPIKAAKLLAYEKEILADHTRIRCNPLLHVLAFLHVQLGKVDLHYSLQLRTVAVHFE